MKTNKKMHDLLYSFNPQKLKLHMYRDVNRIKLYVRLCIYLYCLRIISKRRYWHTLLILIFNLHLHESLWWRHQKIQCALIFLCVLRQIEPKIVPLDWRTLEYIVSNLYMMTFLMTLSWKLRISVSILCQNLLLIIILWQYI